MFRLLFHMIGHSWQGVFTMPWSSMITYRRALGDWTDLICAENRHEYLAGKDSAVPTANTPDF